MSYCFNPTCKQPENSQSSTECQCCGTSILLLDRYRAIRLIGQGGFGRTLLVTDETDHSRCVVKQFYPQSNNEKAAELFRLEAQRLETLGQHPQIPKLLNYFESESNQYLVQEFVDGCNLAQELAEVGAFNESQIRQLLQDILPILKYVHEHQVIHRDIKPENIVRRAIDRKLVLVDFGAAKYTTETTLGKTGTMIGSAAYTAPEQVRGKAVFASDLYSLGVTCIHLLTQMSPFELFDSGDNKWVWRHFLGRKVTADRFVQVKKPKKAAVSDWLGTVLDKMLESGTTRRYVTVDQVLKDLRSKPRKFKKRYVLAGVGGLTLVSAIAAIFGLRMVVAPIARMVSPDMVSTNGTVVPPAIAGLYSTKSGEQKSFPLQHTEVMARVTGNVSRVEVTQTFSNPYQTPLEAVYTFPLPDEAAVDDMEIRVGNRIIRGLIKQRQEAQKMFDEAKQQGKTAGLLEQQRDNVFTQSLANIKPGEKIDVKIRYTESLKFEKGSYEFAFPMVVAPRYLPATGVADAAKFTTAQIPATRSGQNIGMTIELDAGVPIKGLNSNTHKIQTQKEGKVTRVQFAKEDVVPNKDFVLNYQVADTKAQSTTLTDADSRGGHFATYLIPAVEYQQNEIVPKDVVFLMDTSGSQSGKPIQDSKALMQRFINGLNPNDTFTIIDFASTTQRLSAQPLANTPENRKRAQDYVSKIDANGGSELFNGIQAVMNFPPAPEGRLRSVVLITDGLVGDDERVIAEVQKNLKPGNRLYSFGTGSSVNRFLIDRVAELGRGTSHIVMSDEKIDTVVEKFFQEINNPVLTNVEVSWQGSGEAPEIYPKRIPDLFANQPIVVFGKKRDRTDGTLKITGTTAGGGRFEKVIPVDFAETTANLSGGIAQLWGRARIKELSHQMFAQETEAGIKAITETALDYRLLSKYTAFIAVSQNQRVEPNSSQKVDVPVEVPAGMQPTGGNTTQEVPEPAEIAGSLVAIALLWWRFGRKRAKPVDAVKH
ncbi:MAG: protein kinase [Leptolyngbya sp. Prado105]|jgi:Ca-activated chloride channel family protein|nr:protein kinase [Leptolyngbya sp. Prado105]